MERHPTNPFAALATADAAALAMPRVVFMLLAEPRFDELSTDSRGNPRIGSRVAKPRSIFVDEAKARAAAAHLAHKLDRRVFVLKSIASCTPPPPLPPEVVWDDNVIDAIVDCAADGADDHSIPTDGAPDGGGR